MLKKRLIPALFIKDGLIVRSENFQKFKVIGNVVNEVRRYNEWDIDELIYIDISRGQKFDSGRSDHKINRVNSIGDVLDLVSRECFMPLTFGGRVENFETIRSHLRHGADKVVINTMAYTDPKAVSRASEVFGKQAIVFSCDYRIIDGRPKFFSHNGTLLQHESLDELIDLVAKIKCGEVMLHAIDRDGEADGFDLEFIGAAVKMFDVPVIVCGGAGSIYDFEDVANIHGVSGIVAGNWFHFTEQAYPKAKSYLKRRGLNFR